MKKLIINCKTKEEQFVDLTAEDIADKEAMPQVDSPFDKPTTEDRIKDLEDRLAALEPTE